VADTAGHRIVVFAPNGQPITTIGSYPRHGSGSSTSLFAMAWIAKTGLYVCDSLNFRIQQFSPQLQPLRAIGRKG
jgi:hypothetical protein